MHSPESPPGGWRVNPEPRGGTGDAYRETSRWRMFPRPSNRTTVNVASALSAPDGGRNSINVESSMPDDSFGRSGPEVVRP